MAYRGLKSLAAVASVVVLGWALQACSGSAHEQGSVGTGGESGLTVSTTSGNVAVENNTGDALVDVDLTINPVGGTTVYSHSLSTLAKGERREVPLGDFKAKNGATINRMFMVPKNVVVTASDTAGKKHQVTVPWQ